MSTQYPPPDAARSKLRTLAAVVDKEVGRHANEPLTTAWAGLVDALALGPEPETRACPVCQRLGMRLATVCGHCWTKLSPLPHTT